MGILALCVSEDSVDGGERMAEIKGIGPDAEIVVNERGGKQSKAVAAFHLLDAPTMIRLGKVLQYGASRYGRDNWRKIPCEDHLNHALAHIFAAFAGDTQDDHLGHAFCRLMMACATEADGSLERRAEWWGAEA
jgi:hypothetical protein